MTGPRRPTTCSTLALDGGRRGRGAGRPRCAPSGVEVADTKSSPIDIVTEADRAAEELIRDRLLARPARRRVPRRGGRRRAGTSGRALGRRPDRRHRELPLRHPALRRLDRRRASTAEVGGRGGARRPPRAWSTPRTLGGGADLRRRARSGSAARRTAGAAAGRHRLQLRADGPRAARPAASPRLLPRGPRHPAARARAPSTCARWPPGRLDAYVEEGAHLWDHAAGGLVADGGRRHASRSPRAPAASDLLVVRPGGRFRPSSGRSCVDVRLPAANGSDGATRPRRGSSRSVTCWSRRHVRGSACRPAVDGAQSGADTA